MGKSAPLNQRKGRNPKKKSESDKIRRKGGLQHINSRGKGVKSTGKGQLIYRGGKGGRIIKKSRQGENGNFYEPDVLRKKRKLSSIREGSFIIHKKEGGFFCLGKDIAERNKADARTVQRGGEKGEREKPVLARTQGKEGESFGQK